MLLTCDEDHFLCHGREVGARTRGFDGCDLARGEGAGLALRPSHSHWSWSEPDGAHPEVGAFQLNHLEAMSRSRFHPTALLVSQVLPQPD
jgi:hypothetical protein